MSAVEAFVRDRLAPAAAAIDESNEFPTELVREACGLGLASVLMDDDKNLDVTRIRRGHEVSEALASQSMAVGVAVTNCRLMPYLLSKYAPSHLTSRWVWPTLRGEVFGAFGITEPHAGSDVRGMSSVARADGDHWVLNGGKCWVGYAPNGAYAITLVKEGSDARGAPMLALVVDLASPGVTRGWSNPLSGLRGMANGWLRFSDVRVPKADRLQVEGFGGMMDGLNMARIDAASYACGLVRGALDESVARAATRRAFGGALGDLQSIQAKIGRMAADYRAGLALTLEAADSFAAGDGGDMDLISMAKLFTSEAARRHTDAAVQIFGAQGMDFAHRVNRLNRDAKVTQIFDGASEVHETMLGRRAVRAWQGAQG